MFMCEDTKDWRGWTMACCCGFACSSYMPSKLAVVTSCSPLSDRWKDIDNNGLGSCQENAYLLSLAPSNISGATSRCTSPGSHPHLWE